MRLYTKILLLAMLLIVLLAGCSQPINKEKTALPVSTLRATETMMPALTPTALQTNTPNAIPTLYLEQAQARLLALLAKNSDCSLPCLWGITPGKSLSHEAQVILNPLISISDLTSLLDSPSTIWPIYAEGNLRTFVRLSYLFGNDDIISHISFKAGIFKKLSNDRPPVYDSKTFGERLRPYMLSGILSEFGKPASMVIHTYGKQITGTGGFEIVLVYPEQGMLIHYITQMQTTAANAKGCPANAEVELELYPAGDADYFVKSLSTTSWAIFVQKEPVTDLVWKAHWKPIEEATSMSLEQFYEVFRQPTDKCIETPMKIWALPAQ